MTLVLSDSDVAQIVSPRDAVDACESAYADLGRGLAATTMRRDLIFPAENYETNKSIYRFVTMEGGTQALGVIAQRIDSERVAISSEGGVYTQVEIPITSSSRFVGLVYLYSMKTGELLAILNDGEIGRNRVSCDSRR